jgi:LysM repeat protein
VLGFRKNYRYIRVCFIMRKFFYIFILLGLALGLGLGPTPTSAQASSAYDVVAAVNDFRAANGLPPLQIDPILMSIAQAHSDYQASIGTVTHTGSGGSRPIDRAYAAGFGGGATIFISENIAGGVNLSIQAAIYQYWQDQAHLNTMLNPATVYIGAGVGVSGNKVYYTVDAGYYAGAPSTGSTSIPTGGSTKPGSTAVVYDPFVVSTPREDGAIVHIVAYGQSLIGIVKTYKVELNEIMQLNGLSLNSIIYPGDKIIIKTGVPITPTPSPTETAPYEETTDTPKAASGSKITPTPRKTFTPVPTASPTASATPIAITTGREQLVLGVVIMAFLVFLAVIASSFLARNKPEP